MYKQLLIGTAALSVLACAACSREAAPPADATPVNRAAEARSIAEETYIFGVPMVDTYKTVYAFNVDTTNPQYKGPFSTRS